MEQSYKIYINNVVVYLVGWKKTFKVAKRDASIQLYPCKNKTELKKIITAIEIGSITSNIIIASNDLEKLKEMFFSCFKIIKAGGGLVRNQSGDYLMIYRNDKWDIPKGKIEKDEKIKKGAERETMEETGLEQIKNIAKLGLTHHTYKLKDNWVLKETHWYLMLADENANLIPQKSENIQQVGWFTKREVKNNLKNSYKSIKEVFEMEKNYRRMIILNDIKI